MTGLLILLAYVAFFVGAYFIVNFIQTRGQTGVNFTSLKTVTFGDESAITPNRAASVISILVIFLIWGAFTGSKISPIHVPGPFLGETAFEYTVTNEAGSSETATVYVNVHEADAEVDVTESKPPREGFAQDDIANVLVWRSVLIKAAANDGEGARVTAVNGQALVSGDTVKVADGEVTMSRRGSLNFTPSKGYQMEPIWLPSPEAVVSRFAQISTSGYQNFTLWDHIGASMIRVLAGFVLGSLVGIPLGYAMGLSSWVRGWFDPIVEFMRPVPPLALIPLVIIWFGIWETGKIVLLFLAALWVMTIAARAGVSGVNITKVHAAYSLGASKAQILRHVIVPNSLPEIFTGARVAMGVCWGTVVAAELVAAQKGAGMMIIAASKFQLTDIVIMGIILIGVIGYGIDILMRQAEKILVPWKGRS